MAKQMATLDIRLVSPKLPVEPDGEYLNQFEGVESIRVEMTFLIDFDPNVTDAEELEWWAMDGVRELYEDSIEPQTDEDIPLPEITSEIRWWT